MLHNKVNIEALEKAILKLQSDVKEELLKLQSDVEKLKDKQRSFSNGSQ